MLKFEAIASSSEGNAYIVSDGVSSLLLECGINYKDIQKALNFKVSQVAGCLITHEHQDHCKSTKEVLRAGVNVYLSHGTAQALNLNHHRIKTVESLKQFQLGTWTVLPFSVEHDVSEPLGYLIMNDKGEKLLFATDTYFIRYRFKGINIIAVECNYSEEILNNNIINGEVPYVFKRRVERSHFSLENYKDFLQANDLSEVREIWMLHMSSRNANPEKFKEEIKGQTGKMVYVA
ncbi:MBL fold metallo-hydrolase [Virgibacillus sp. CBA3643]|uniref:MBL fold metallo-hydrolase n=1 Tax=Virgibacillus sp. CBA3643 TaxID=2942278 RepID=UPI0035A32AD9